MSKEPMHPHLSAERLQALLEGEISERERLSAEEHLAACARCSAELDAWSVLFSTLGEIGELAPQRDFADRVMADVHLAGSVPFAVRARARLRALWPSRNTAHPAADRLQEFLEGALSSAQAARVRAHLHVCEACAREAEAWSGLMHRLDALPRLAPAEEFEDEVMARVRVPVPAPALAAVPARTRAVRALAVFKRLIPRTRRAWAAISGVAVTPAASLGLLVYAMFSQPALTPGALASFVWWKANDLALGAWHGVVAHLLESDSLFRAYALLESVRTAPWALVLAFAAFSILSAAALWVLYRNIIVHPSVEGGYAHVDS